MNSTIQNLNFPVDEIQFNRYSKAKNFEITKEILHELYDAKYDDELENLFSIMKLDCSLLKIDSAIRGDYDTTSKTKSCIDGIIYSLTESYVPILLSHEFTHTFYDKTFSKGRNRNYNEFCSIFADFFASYKMNLYTGEDILANYQMIRYDSLKRIFEEFTILQDHLSEFMKPNHQLSDLELAYKYSYYNSYGYIINTIYSYELFVYYLESPIEVLKDFQKIVSHEQDVLNVLEKYNISLRNTEEIIRFQKTLQKIAK